MSRSGGVLTLHLVAAAAMLVPIANVAVALEPRVGQRFDTLDRLYGVDVALPANAKGLTLEGLLGALAVTAGFELETRIDDDAARAVPVLSEEARSVRAALHDLREDHELFYFVATPGRLVVVQAKRAGSSDVSPRIIGQVDAMYPPAAKEAGREGDVWIEGLVTTEGAVEYLRVLRQPDEEMGAAALAAVRRWRFEPGRHAGRAVNTIVVFTVSFRIPESR